LFLVASYGFRKSISLTSTSDMTAEQIQQIIKEKEAERKEVNRKLEIVERAENDGTRDGYERNRLIGQITDLTKQSSALSDQIRDWKSKLEKLG
jgi:uncharacterized protein YajQ (UPF0234 family)